MQEISIGLNSETYDDNFREVAYEAREASWLTLVL